MTRYLVMHREPEDVDDYFDEATDEENARLIGLEGLYAIGGALYSHMGTAYRPHLYRSIANARRVARDPSVFMAPDKTRKRDVSATSKILIFDPSRLLEVANDVLFDTKSLDREDDLVIAERQIQLWSDRLAMLQRAQAAQGRNA